MHQSVLLNEVLNYLNLSPGKKIIDCTFGWGGHSLEILKRVQPNGQVLGIERDQEVFKKQKEEEGLILKQGNFSDLKKISKDFNPVDGILLDLGLSSWQIDQSQRGFSFLKDEPLIMRTGPEGITAWEIVNGWTESQLRRIILDYGEEKYAGRIAKLIYKKRRKEKIKTTYQLIDIIKEAVPISYQRKKIHFATKTFQALRIAVNDELGNLEKVLPQALEILKKDGRLVVISFHSLEDRIVKNFFRQQNQEKKLKILTKKPVSPTLEEIKINSRSRSAKLRVIQKI